MKRAPSGDSRDTAPSRAEWTYELPPATGDSVWLEDYLVYDSTGAPAGKVFAVLEHEGRRWLGVEIGHEHLAVHLGLSAERPARPAGWLSRFHGWRPFPVG